MVSMGTALFNLRQNIREIMDEGSQIDEKFYAVVASLEDIADALEELRDALGQAAR